MALWPVPDTTEEPAITIERWRVYETDQGTRHLVGYCIERREGRVSSAVNVLDSQTRVATTRSGRRYLLEGRPGFDDDADYAWQRWKRFNGVQSETEVTDRIWSDFQLFQNSEPRQLN